MLFHTILEDIKIIIMVMFKLKRFSFLLTNPEYLKMPRQTAGSVMKERKMSEKKMSSLQIPEKYQIKI